MHQDVPTVCVACGQSDLVPAEIIRAATIADAWAREDRANGQFAQARERSQALMAALPDEIRFDRCAACGLEMASPPIVWSGKSYPSDQSYPVRWEFHQCVDDLGTEPLDVLELGCGPGEFLSLAAGAGHRAVGIDFSESAITTARERGVRAYHASLDTLERHVGASARFDAVVLFQVIEHLADPGAIFRALDRWMRPGARVFISCPGPRRFTRLIGEQRAGESDFWDYPPHHVLRWTLPALSAFASRHGWQTVSAIEEPFSRLAVASQIGVARAIYQGHLGNAIRRRLHIGVGWLRAATAPRERRSGASIYFVARRTETTS